MCESSCSVMIAEPVALACTTAVADATCNGDSNGSTMVTASGGVAPYTYLWDDLAAQTTQTATSLTAGTYTVVVTDANGCTVMCSAVVDEPVVLACSLMPTDVTCNGNTDGSLTVTGTGGITPYAYSLDGGPFQGVNVFSNLSAGNYVVTTRDANLCVTTCMITIDEPMPISCSTDVDDPSNCGIDDGTITITGTGGSPAYEYSLDGGAYQTGNVFGSLSAGSYTISIRDVNGCVSTCSATLALPQTPTCSVATVDAVCAGDATGELTVTATGGSAPYEYSLDGLVFQAGNSFVGLTAGMYTVTVRSAAQPNCESTCSGTVGEPLVLACSSTHTDVSCNGFSDGEATVVASGGVAPYAYLWDDLGAQTTAKAQ